MPNITLSSTRLRFRPCTPEDRETLHAHWTRPGVRKYLFDDEAISIARVDGFIAESQTFFQEHGYGHWVLEDAVSGAFIGYAGIRPVDEYAAPEVLYSIEPEQWGRGLATEAAQRLVSYALDELGLPRIVGDIDPPNVVSGHVLRKIGMTYLGRFKRHEQPTDCFEIRSDAADSESGVRPASE